MELEVSGNTFKNRERALDRRSFIKTVGAGVFGLSFGGCIETLSKSSKAKTERPNIILIISDDAGYSDFGFTGGDQIPTPNIDRMARDGVICSQGYVTAPVCCPSRMAMMTGRYQQRFGAECNVPMIPTPGFTKKDLGMDTDEIMIAGELKKAGYKTMMIGKWHLGELPKYHPNKRGFDKFYGFLGGSRSYWPLENPSRGHAIMRDNERVDEEKEIEYLTDDLTDAALEFVKDNSQNPFFVCLSYSAVHTPMHAKEEDIEQFSSVSFEKRRIYAAMTSSLDQNIGRLRKTLQQHGLIENTLIIFVNDNGGPTGANASNNKPLRGTKGTFWEGGIRVPFYLTWPATLPSGKKYDHPVSSMDLFPTMLEAAGRSTTKLSLDGVSLLPYLRGQRSAWPHEYLFWRLWQAGAVRKGDWKLIRIAEDPLKKDRQLLGPLILVNLQEDPAETKNLAENYPEITNDLLGALENWEKDLSQPRWYDGKDWQHWANMQVKNHKI